MNNITYIPVFQYFLQYILYPWEFVVEHWLIIRILLATLSLFLLIGIIIYIIKTDFFYEKREFGIRNAWDYHKSDTKNAQKEWNNILKIVDIGDTNRFKEALLTADSLLAETLKRSGYKGIRMEEILDNIYDQDIKGIESLKVERERIFSKINDEDFVPNVNETKKLLREYRSILRFLNIIK